MSSNPKYVKAGYLLEYLLNLQQDVEEFADKVKCETKIKEKENHINVQQMVQIIIVLLDVLVMRIMIAVFMFLIYLNL